ncbi:hypothetical protein BGZ73_008633 [Actinomortierella ambigua]|nr:hypothetical protein BGZ73_008633 [Actinomortierella ambigua]
MLQHHAHDNSDHLSELSKRTDSTFELHYFRSVGQGGVIRSLLVLGKANWKDRFETMDSWPAVKPTTPFGTLPVLYETTSSGEVLQIAERDVIERYLAKKFGFFGKNEWEEILSLIKGLMNSFYTTLIIGPASDLAANKEKFLTQTLPTFVNHAEALLSRNEGNPHFVGKKISLADVMASSALDFFLGVEGVDKVINQKDTPLLLKVKEAIDTNPDHSAYRKSEIFDTLSQASAKLLTSKFGNYDPSKSRMFS